MMPVVAVAVLPVNTEPPPPDGVAQVPSPRQKVEDDALVPLFKLPTGRFPVTPVLNGSPVRLDAVPLAGVPKAPPLTRHVGHEIVPVLVIVPPDIGLLVATLVTVPVPEPLPPVACHALPDQRHCVGVALAVPAQSVSVMIHTCLVVGLPGRLA